MAGSGWGRLGLWLRLRGPTTSGPAPIALPDGTGPILLMHVAADAETAATQVEARLKRAQPDLRILRCDGRDMQASLSSRAGARTVLSAARPAAILLLGSDLPAALITSAGQQGLPMVLGEARLGEDDAGWRMNAAMRRHLLGQMRAVLVTDAASQETAIRIGIDPRQVTMTGPVADIRDPLGCTEAERQIFAELLNTRHAWLAASVPESEEAAVLAAHRAAMRQSHRTLLFLAPRNPGRIDALAAMLEAEGLAVARRSHDEEPTEEVHVMITDGPTEMGLWYRLAPVSYMGGTLSGEDDGARHPFEPAALGSAIVHGPRIDRHPTEWQQLDGARAARQVIDAAGLAAAIAELTQPDLVASLASNAWTVSTGGADVAARIAAPVLQAIDEATT